MTKKHVVVIGAGFAGLMAARELQAAGISVEMIEARDRIGGRAWTEERMGRPLELGATWVHWYQAHTWTEIVRYNQPIVASPEPQTVYWNRSTGETCQGTMDDVEALLRPAMAEVFARGDEYFPNPLDPMWILSDRYDGPVALREQFLADDQKSVLDIIRESGKFSHEQLDLISSYWAAGYIGNPDTGSSLMAKQWAALSNMDLGLLDDITLKFKLVNGMQGIYNAMAEDLTCNIRLNTPVTKVQHTTEGVAITLEDGEVLTADATIVTVPVGAMNTIEFSPALPQKMQKVVDRGWNSKGAKIWIKIQGHHKILGYAPFPAKMSVVRSEYFTDDDTTILVGFGGDHLAVDLNDTAVAQEIINQFNPELEVIDSTGHDWVADKWSGQAWGTLQRGQFSDGWDNFKQTGTQMYFAGTEWSKGWRGVCIDGALESGMTTARRIIQDFRQQA